MIYALNEPCLAVEPTPYIILRNIIYNPGHDETELGGDAYGQRNIIG